VRTTRAGPVARRLAAADPAGLLYGAIVSATALAAVSLHTPEASRVAVVTGTVLVIYWMADLYVHALAMRFDGDARRLMRRLGRSAAHKSSVLKGGLPGIAVYLGVYARDRERLRRGVCGTGQSAIVTPNRGGVSRCPACGGRTADRPWWRRRVPGCWVSWSWWPSRSCTSAARGTCRTRMSAASSRPRPGARWTRTGGQLERLEEGSGHGQRQEGGVPPPVVLDRGW
jgi:hypothetical protein